MNNLNEAAEKYANDRYEAEAFKAGAQWQLEQPQSQVSDDDIEKMAEDAWAKEPFNDMDKFCDTFIKGAKAALQYNRQPK